MTFLIVTGIIAGFMMLIYFIKSGHFFKNFFKSTILTIICFALVFYFGKYVNLSLTLNIFTAAYSLILGVPGIILLIVTKYFIL